MATQKYVALLRGINVGGNNMVSMAVLKSLFEGLGFSDVVTYINSGNVIFAADGSDVRKMESNIEQKIYLEFGIKVSVVIVSGERFVEIEKGIPESWKGDVDQKCNVIFLRHEIDNSKLIENFHPKAGIEELHYSEGVLYWSALTSDLTKSDMLKLAKSPLYKMMTVRNLNTVRKIAGLMS